jgi:hypothetical protein
VVTRIAPETPSPSAPAQLVSPDALVDADDPRPEVEVRVHDASRLAFSVNVPMSRDRDVSYTFALELETPAGALVGGDPWVDLQSHARLNALEPPTPAAAAPPARASAQGALASIQRTVLGASARIARARDALVRDVAQQRMATGAIEVAERALSHAREELVRIAEEGSTREQAPARDGASPFPQVTREAALADEYLSARYWAFLSDAARAVFKTSSPKGGSEARDAVSDLEGRIYDALERELAHRRRREFPNAEPTRPRKLERFLHRARWLKKHFHRVLFLETRTTYTNERWQSWWSAAGAMLAYIWFFVWQLAFERGRRGAGGAIGSGLVLFVVVTAVMYGSREKIKDAVRDWLKGRVQRLFAQRFARYHLPRVLPGGERRLGPVVARARESFTQSSAERPDPVDATGVVTVTVTRFFHRGTVVAAARGGAAALSARQVRHVFRYDLTRLFPKLHDEVKGLVVPDRSTRRLVLQNVPRTYELPIRVELRVDSVVTYEASMLLVLNKRGLVRLERAPTATADRGPRLR